MDTRWKPGLSIHSDFDWPWIGCVYWGLPRLNGSFTYVFSCLHESGQLADAHFRSEQATAILLSE